MSLCKSCQAVCLFILGIALLPVMSWSQTGPDPKLIEGAKKEGQLVYYTTMTLDQSKQSSSTVFSISFPTYASVSWKPWFRGCRPVSKDSTVGGKPTSSTIPAKSISSSDLERA
jgi:hypothetical protein